jgi:hypothetical protein
MTARHTSLGEKAAIHLGMQLTVHAVAAKLTYLNPTMLG